MLFMDYGDYMKAKNVIVTSFRLSAIGWFTGVLSEIHNAIYGNPINWNYEISRFECTRKRRALPQGWNTVWNANPLTLAERGFDKVLVVKRPWQDILEACCWYDKQMSSIGVILNKYEDDYVKSLMRNYWKLYRIKDVHPNIFYIDIEDLNQNTVQQFKEICKFLEFDMGKFPVLIPIKVKKDWEVYAGYNKGLELQGRLKLIKEARKNGND